MLHSPHLALRDRNANGSNTIMFDPTITLGAVIAVLTTIVSGAVGIFVFAWTMRSRIDIMEVKMDGIKGELSGIRQILETQIRHDQRILDMERRIAELAHGEGFVLPIKPRAGYNPND
jgi:hypothetical protein